MSKDGKRFRSWQEIALEAWRERNPERLRELTKELETALDERDKKLNPQPVPPKRRCF
jgi:ferric-dicitrate binding protein FerR (iron transport regulator)